jgi:hypothetical protein
VSPEVEAAVRHANKLFGIRHELSEELNRYAREPKFRDGSVLYMTDAGYAERCVRLARISHEWVGARDQAMAALVKEAELQT